jgi:hypothetical protein
MMFGFAWTPVLDGYPYPTIFRNRDTGTTKHWRGL